MKNYVSDGDKVTISAVAAIVSGAGLLSGAMFGVAQNSAGIGEDVTLQLTGIVDLPKAASQAWTVGAKVYWDNAAKVMTTTATNNTLVGVAAAAVAGGAGDTVGRVRLNGSF